MSLKTLVEKRKHTNSKIRVFVDEAKELCKTFFNIDYKYSDTEAVEELGVDSDLIDQLLEDFTIQIIQSNISFYNYLDTFKEEHLRPEEIDFTDFRELAHKNLGVARNLRIKDSQEVLSRLMKEENLEKINTLLQLLQACVIKLKPLTAYEAILLLELKK